MGRAGREDGKGREGGWEGQGGGRQLLKNKRKKNAK